ncbi:MAG: hypothetical protein M3N42_11125 [Cyanobacteriota bacterium]|nr:hypothetical protein [Cyanobacteriota bacterium]
MAGNENAICEFLFSNLKCINVRHIGQLMEIGIPLSNRSGYYLAQSLDDILKIATMDSRKKADVYLNGKGVSIKQAGGSFAFNRLQRTNILEVYSNLELTNPQFTLAQLDKEIKKFHEGLLPNRNLPWQVYSFDEYFETYKENFQIAIRRQWVGQSSNSEHQRALGLSSKPENLPWVFNDVVGTPRLGWRDDVVEADRKTVYFLMIEKSK